MKMLHYWLWVEAFKTVLLLMLELFRDKFIILASDGIWEFISNDECVNLIKDYYIKKYIIEALNSLYKKESKRWIIEEEFTDNIIL